MDAEKKYENLKIGQLFRWHCQSDRWKDDFDDIGVLTNKDYNWREMNILWSSDGKIAKISFYDYEEILLIGALEII